MRETQSYCLSDTRLTAVFVDSVEVVTVLKYAGHLKYCLVLKLEDNDFLSNESLSRMSKQETKRTIFIYILRSDISTMVSN